ncbi:NUDIX hydrolase [Anaerosacchariphilus polymeriproducens]|nr:NUDIX domain-containing protein [Anaerosacchariphilus polymeriproducens]
MFSIYKVGGIILNSKKLLVVRKKTLDNRSEFIIPGGKSEKGENDEDTLKRELKEELNVNLLDMNYFDSYSDIAVFENIPISMNVYTCDIDGSIIPMNEIKEYIWIDRNYEQNNIQLGSILSKYIVPKLIILNLM